MEELFVRLISDPGRQNLPAESIFTCFCRCLVTLPVQDHVNPTSVTEVPWITRVLSIQAARAFLFLATTQWLGPGRGGRAVVNRSTQLGTWAPTFFPLPMRSSKPQLSFVTLSSTFSKFPQAKVALSVGLTYLGTYLLLDLSLIISQLLLKKISFYISPSFFPGCPRWDGQSKLLSLPLPEAEVCNTFLTALLGPSFSSSSSFQSN